MTETASFSTSRNAVKKHRHSTNSLEIYKSVAASTSWAVALRLQGFAATLALVRCFAKQNDSHLAHLLLMCDLYAYFLSLDRC